MTETISVNELDSLAERIYSQEKIISEIEEQKSAANLELSRLKATMVKHLRELGREEFRAKNGGLLKINQRWRVNAPATDEDKALLFDHLRAAGVYDRYATVNANSINSYYMAEWEAAKKRGEGMEFSMPGIGAPKLHEDLTPYKPRTKKEET